MTHEPYLTNLRSLVGDYTQEYLGQKVDRFWPYRMSRKLRLDKAREHSPKSRHLYLHSSFWPSKWTSFLCIKLYPNAAKNRQDKQSTAVDAIYDALEKDLGGDGEAAYNILKEAGVNITEGYPSVTLLNLLKIHKIVRLHNSSPAATEKTGPSGNRSLSPVRAQQSEALRKYLIHRSFREDLSTTKAKRNQQLRIRAKRKAKRASGRPAVATSPKAKDPSKERRKNRQAGSAFRRALVRSYRYVKKRINQGNSNSSAYQNSRLLDASPPKTGNLQSDRMRADTALKLQKRDIRNAEAKEESFDPVLSDETPADRATQLIAALRSSIARDLSPAKSPQDKNLGDSIKVSLDSKDRVYHLDNLQALWADEEVKKDSTVKALLQGFFDDDWPKTKEFYEENTADLEAISQINEIAQTFAELLGKDGSKVKLIQVPDAGAWRQLTPAMIQKQRVEATMEALESLENAFSKNGNIDQKALQIVVNLKTEPLEDSLKEDHVRFDWSVREKLHNIKACYTDRSLDSSGDAGSIDANNEADANKEASAVLRAESLVTKTLEENVRDAKRLITQLGRKVENDINAEESSIPAADELQPQDALEALQLLLEEEEVEQSEEVKEMLKGFIEGQWPKFKEFCTQLDKKGEEQFDDIIRQNNRIFEGLAKAFGYHEDGIRNDVYRSLREKQKDIEETKLQFKLLSKNINSSSRNFGQRADKMMSRSLRKLSTYLEMAHVLADEAVQEALAENHDYYTKFLEENEDNKDNNVPVAVLRAVERILKEISTALDLVDAARQESALQPEAPKPKQQTQVLETVPENTSLTIDSEDAPEHTEVVEAQSSLKRNADSGDAAQALDRLLGALGGTEAPSVPPNTGDALTEVVAARSSSKPNADSGEATQALDSLLEVLDKTEVPPVEKAAVHDDKSKAAPQQASVAQNEAAQEQPAIEALDKNPAPKTAELQTAISDISDRFKTILGVSATAEEIGSQVEQETSKVLAENKYSALLQAAWKRIESDEVQELEQDFVEALAELGKESLRQVSNHASSTNLPLILSKLQSKLLGGLDRTAFKKQIETDRQALQKAIEELESADQKNLSSADLDEDGNDDASESPPATKPVQAAVGDDPQETIPFEAE